MSDSSLFGEIDDIFDELESIELPEDSEFKDCLEAHSLSPSAKAMIYSMAHFHNQVKKESEKKPFTDDYFLQTTPYLSLPIPSRLILSLDSNEKFPFEVNGSTLFMTELLGDEKTVCTFSPCVDKETIVPDRIKTIECKDNRLIIALKNAGSEKLRFYLNLNQSKSRKLYYYLFNLVDSIEIITSGGSKYHCEIKPCYHDTVAQIEKDDFFSGFQSLHDLEIFPEKFMFFELVHTEAIPTDDYLIIINFNKLPFSVLENDLLLNCIPMINIFQSSCEPITIDYKKNHYPLIVDSDRLDSKKMAKIIHLTSDKNILPRSSYQITCGKTCHGVIFEEKQPYLGISSAFAYCYNGNYPYRYMKQWETLKYSDPKITTAMVMTRPKKSVLPRNSNFSIWTDAVHFLLDPGRFSSIDTVRKVIDLFFEGEKGSVTHILDGIVDLSQTSHTYFEEGKLVVYDICDITYADEIDLYSAYICCRLIHQIFRRFCDFFHKHRTNIYLVKGGLLWTFGDE